MPFETLPSDILFEILSHLSKSDAANLRATSRRVEGFTAPHFFQNLVWDLSWLGSAAKLESFVTHVAKARYHVTVLCLKKVNRRLLFGSDATIQIFAQLISNGSRPKGRTTRARRILKCLRRLFNCSCLPLKRGAPDPADADNNSPSVKPAKVLSEALGSLEKLHRLKWTIDISPAGIETLIFSSLAQISSLKGLVINFHHEPVVTFTLPLHRLSNLETVEIYGPVETVNEYAVQPLSVVLGRSPNLLSLHVSLTDDHPNGLVSLREIFSKLDQPMHLRDLYIRGPFALVANPEIMAHFRSLSSLTLCPKPTRQNLASHRIFFRALEEEQVLLCQLTTEMVHDELMSYLSSYSGLTRLCLRRIITCIKYVEHLSNEQQAKYDHLADLFYDATLPCHRATLRELQIWPNYNGRWCVSMQKARLLGICHELRSVALSPFCLETDDGLALEEHAHLTVDLTLRRLYELPHLSSVILSPAVEIPGASATTIHRTLLYLMTIESDLHDYSRHPELSVLRGKRFAIYKDDGSIQYATQGGISSALDSWLW